MSILVKSITKDEDTGTRIVKVNLSSSKHFETPTRSLTSTEHTYKKDVFNAGALKDSSIHPTEADFSNDIYQISKSFEIIQLQKLLKINGSFKNAKRDIASKKKAYLDKFAIFYPHFSKKMLFEENQIIGIENLKTIVDLQILSGFENVSMPESNPNQNIGTFKSDLTSLSKRAVSSGAKVLIPYLDMGMGKRDPDLFSSKYNHLIDEGFNVIGVVFRNYSENYPNFRFLEGRDDDVLIYCSGVDRYWNGDWTTSQIHTPNFNGVDITALLSKQSPPSNKEKTIEEIKRFDKESLGIIKLKNHLSMYGEALNCDCPICKGKTLSELKEKYSINQERFEVSYLDKIFKLHETYASTKEFENERKYIKSNESKEYIDSHDYLKSYLSTVKH